MKYLSWAVVGMVGSLGCGSGSTAENDAGGDSATDGARKDAADAGKRADAHPQDAARDVAFDGGFDAAPGAVCDAAEIARGCVSGPCVLTGPESALGPGVTVTVGEIPVPSGLTSDALGTSMCQLTVQGATIVSGLTLALTPSETTSPPVGAALFAYESPAQSTLVTTSQATGDTVEGIVFAPATYGATVSPGTWSVSGVGGVDVASSSDEATLLRNLSSQTMNASFYDGTHLFVCNGPRLLIYNTLPAGPGVPPDLVLGQPGLDTTIVSTTSSLFGSACTAIWADGTRLAVAQGARVLIWQTLPTQSQTPADLVLGEPDFASNKVNNGGVSAVSLSQVRSIDSNGNDLVVADELNNRVLVWNEFPSLVDQPADFVVGQPNLSTGASEGGAVPFALATGAVISGSGAFLLGYESPGLVHVSSLTTSNPLADFTAFPLAGPIATNPSVLDYGGSLSLTPSGGVAVADALEPRVVVTKATPSAPATQSFVLSQPFPNAIVESPESASLLYSLPNSGALLGRGAMFSAADAQRLLLFSAAPAYNFAPATAVIGQAGFTSNGEVDYRAITAATLANPGDVALAGGTLAVADTSNNRILLFPSSSLTVNDASAAVVVGQSGFSNYDANVNQATPSATTLSGPAGVALDGTHLVVADTENHRVLIWNSVPTTSGAAADLVLGQTDFTGRSPNHGNGDADGDGFSDTDGRGLFFPTGVASDGTHLFVADRVNHRVLVWYAFPTSNGQVADAVLGQPNATSVQANAGAGPYTVAAGGFDLPTGLTISGTTLWVADTENNRVVQWANATTAGTATPAKALGQASLTAVGNPNTVPMGQPFAGLAASPSTVSASVLRPRAVVVAGDRIYISETDSNRVHMFDATSLAPVGELGQTSDTASGANAGGVTSSSLAMPRGLAADGTNLWVADSGNHRVLEFSVNPDPSTGASASGVLGQATFLTNGFNQSSTAANGATSQPRGLSVASGTLYVADTGNNRVLAFSTPLTAGEAPAAVLGQPNGTLALPNAGGAASNATLNAPRGVFTDGTSVFVADTGNNRVLRYDSPGPSATASLVLGQTTMTATGANTGGAGLATMQEPAGVYSDGTHLFVADTGNHRVLVWNTLPTTNGQAADFVLGQTSASGILANNGTSDATATDMSFPSAIQIVNGVLYIADSGNNRVLSYSAVPSTLGAAADGVLGQPNLMSRIAATASVDLSDLAGPVALAADTENLYVSDRDLARAVVYHVGGLTSSGAASLVLGAPGGLTLSAPGGIAVEQTPYFTSRVYVANTGLNSVVVTASVSRIEGE